MAMDSASWYPSPPQTSRTEGVDPWVVLLWKLAVLPAGVGAAGWDASARVCGAKLAVSVVALDHLIRHIEDMPTNFIGILDSSPVTH